LTDSLGGFESDREVIIMRGRYRLPAILGLVFPWLVLWCAVQETRSISESDDSLFQQAESLRRESRYPEASDEYRLILLEFPHREHHQAAVQQLFDIANYWLEDTRTEMVDKQGTQAKRSLPFIPFRHEDRSKPVINQEGRALELLELVGKHDTTGKLAEKAFFLIGSVKFYREAYAEAEPWFIKLVECYPKSTLAPRAVELAILSNRTLDQESRKLREARGYIMRGWAR
jgi:tetratricopeptide (TPR) repeat protein